MLHELALKKVEQWNRPKTSSHSPYLCALLQICAVWPSLHFKSHQENISREEKQMVQLNTKILHPGVPCQISQTFPGWMNGKVVEQAGSLLSRCARSQVKGHFLKAEDLRALQKSRQKGPKRPYRTSQGLKGAITDQHLPLCTASLHQRQEAERNGSRGTRTESFERDTWAWLLQHLARRDEAREHPICTSCQQPSHTRPCLHADILVPEEDQGTKSSTEDPNVIFNISYIQETDIHLPACATSIWPTAYNTLVSHECVNLSQKTRKVLLALPFSTAQVQT